MSQVRLLGRLLSRFQRVGHRSHCNLLLFFHAKLMAKGKSVKQAEMVKRI